MDTALGRKLRDPLRDQPVGSAGSRANSTPSLPTRSRTINHARTIIAAGALFAAAAAFAQAPTDAQIASIVVTANQVDIDAGKLAQKSAHKADVKAFAKEMIADHTGVNKQATELVTKLKVTPEDNPTSQSLSVGGKDNIKTLKTLKGANFEKAYIDHEVAYHEQVIDAIDKTLIPSAKNAELKALLVSVRPAFAAHLAHAQRIQTSLK